MALNETSMKTGDQRLAEEFQRSLIVDRNHRMAERMREYLQQGGWIMIPLVTVSLVMWGLIADRLRDFAGLSRDFSNEQAVQALDVQTRLQAHLVDERTLARRQVLLPDGAEEVPVFRGEAPLETHAPGGLSRSIPRSTSVLRKGRAD